MSEYLGRLLQENCALTDEEYALLTKNLRSVDREERRFLYGGLGGKSAKIKLFLQDAYDETSREEREKWLEVTAESIVEKQGDRDFIDKLAGQVIGSIAVYQRVQKICKEQSIVLKTSSSQGGCTVLLIVMTIVVSLGIYLVSLLK